VWHDTAADQRKRSSLDGDISVDVAIVGGGYTGLWTAYYLSEFDPSLDIAVLERETIGFGASGRNGGWCSAVSPVSIDRLAQIGGRDDAIRFFRTLQQTVDEVGRVAASEGIDAQYYKGGMVKLARNRAQLTRVKAEVEYARRWGFGESDVRLCVQRRLVCSAGDSPVGVTISSPVAWIAGWRETKILKPIDRTSFGEVASHWAVTKVNAQVASKVYPRRPSLQP